MIRVVVVDDHPVVREGLAAVLSDEPDFRIVGQAESGERVISEFERLLPDVVVVDLRLPGISGTETCQALKRMRPSTRVIILTSFPNDGAVMNAFVAGANGFLLKESDPTVLRQAVREVAKGETYVDPRIAAKLVAFASKGRRTKGPFDLTLQEMRVLEKLPRGFTNREIGRELGIAEDTVKTHLSHALRKINAKDRAEAAAFAMREGLA
jgi:DNA-binding NarL/FixJ family response regulator